LEFENTERGEGCKHDCSARQLVLWWRALGLLWLALGTPLFRGVLKDRRSGRLPWFRISVLPLTSDLE